MKSLLLSTIKLSFPITYSSPLKSCPQQTGNEEQTYLRNFWSHPFAKFTYCRLCYSDPLISGLELEEYPDPMDFLETISSFPWVAFTVSGSETKSQQQKPEYRIE